MAVSNIAYPVPHFKIPNPVKTSIPFFLWTRAIEDGPSMTAKNAYVKGKERLDVGIKFLWNYAGNVLGNQHADLNRTHEILQNESNCEFILVWDTHMTASAKYADLILPDASSVENSDLINNSYSSGAYNYLIRLQPAIKPLWENRPTYDVLAALSKKMGVEAQFTEGRSQDEWIEYLYNKLRQREQYLPPFSETDGMGVIDRRLADSDAFIGLKSFRDDPVKYRLTTPSGRVEIYSEALAKIANEWEMAEGDKLYPIPAYLPAIEGYQDRTEKYPLQMIGFHTKGHVHSSYTNLPQLQEAVANSVWINPVDAKSRNIKHGQLVEIYNDRGRLYITAKVTPRILPGVISVPQGLWAKTNDEGSTLGAVSIA
ncbi:molybdopterin dinucleotide binding domain-containing protein [Orbaceae bacterium ESL0721]|nr:molybdopterin dinucleotide binding domain-containing protein [Orbaceae bacterium ESL0721]